jgi:hypothetical protein
MDVDGYMVVNPSVYNQHWCKACAGHTKITLMHKIIYDGLCFDCIDELVQLDKYQQDRYEEKTKV